MGVGPAGWTLARSVRGPLTLEYEVDYARLAAHGWPAPRETAFADAEHLIVIGRSLFIVTPLQRTSEVRFALPRGWQAVVPWPMVGGGRQRATVASTDDLTENLLVFLRGTPDIVTAGGFNLQVITLGHWQPARAEVRRVLGGALRQLVAFIGFGGHVPVDQVQNFPVYLAVAPIVTLFYLGGAWTYGLYDPEHIDTSWLVARGVFAATFVGTILVAAVAFLGGPRTAAFARRVVLLTWPTEFALLAGWPASRRGSSASSRSTGWR